MEAEVNLKECVLGIELGSTRIKAVLIDHDHQVIASGSHEWENSLINGIWTYSLKDAEKGLQACFRDLAGNLGQPLVTAGAIGVSAMMHGYLPFDSDGRQLAEFRTWRNTITAKEAEELTKLFDFNIPQRWSIAHLYHAIQNGEEHVSEIAELTTLAGYIQKKLTGECIMGIGEASGMFPVDSETCDYDETMLHQFDELISRYGFSWKIRDILPKIACAGECAGMLTEEGARFLDPSGILCAGIPVAPCEGDAGTGMAATNSVRIHTGNVSAGTSDFAMIVTDHELGVHPEIDMVTTPSGAPVAMVHCNNCTSDINAWVELFSQFAAMAGTQIDRNTLFTMLFEKALEGEADGGGLMSFNYFSGEHVSGLDEGRPLFVRSQNCRFTLANFMRIHLMSALAALKIGMDILREKENVQIDRIYGHGGFFKTPGVGQRILSAAVNAPVSVMATASEGGPYGMALLGAYMIWKNENETLEDYLDQKVFMNAESMEIMADEKEIIGFESFLDAYKKALPLEKKAAEVI